MRDWRLGTILILGCHFASLEGASTPLLAQAALKVPLDATKPPRELLIPLTQSKLGSRPIPGIEASGYQYRYDPAGLLVGKLKQFEIERHVRPPTAPELEFEWRTTANVEDGDLYPFFGQVYRWSGKTTTLMLVPDHPQAPVEPDPNAQVPVFWKLQLKIPSNAVSRLNLDIKEFVWGEKTADRIKVQVTLDSHKKLILPDKSTGKFAETLTIKAGDRIGSADWDLLLKRIVAPDLKERNPGWAEFIVVPLAKTKK